MRWFIALAAVVHAMQWITLLMNLGYLRRWRPEAHTSGLPSGKLSVLIPAYNEAHNLRTLIPSLLKQDHAHVEFILVDDGSTDETQEVLAGFDDHRLTVLRTQGPPEGWVGKVHALYQATRKATGTHYLFLDADLTLLREDTLSRIDRVFAETPARVLTGLPNLKGGGLLLVSLVASAVLNGLPWPIARMTRRRSLGALNGQCWMVDAETYHKHELHASHRSEILEDVRIGRFLIGSGRPPTLVDLRRDLSVTMYRTLPEAWVGFRKNAYLIVGGTPLAFAALFGVFGFAFSVAPFLSGGLLLSLYALKATTDRFMGMPLWVTALAPVSYLMSSAMQLDSAWHHLTGKVRWKGRLVSPQIAARSQTVPHRTAPDLQV
ncbi:MAG: glycosyltransferase [Rhodothermales bacterium]|nr:glycosyltransferase [Rhodothermales bacterium]MBO6779784.1 glycosyltransferase [Rhodothermales bacterium]